MRMTDEQIAVANAILDEKNLISLGFKKIEGKHDEYGGDCYQYKGFSGIKIRTFMGIKTLELENYYTAPLVKSEDVHKEGIKYINNQYWIYDVDNGNIDIHSNEELISICKEWAKAIKAAVIKKVTELLEYYKNIEV